MGYMSRIKNWLIVEVDCKTNIFGVYDTSDEALNDLEYHFGVNHEDEYGIKYEVIRRK